MDIQFESIRAFSWHELAVTSHFRKKHIPSTKKMFICNFVEKILKLKGTGLALGLIAQRCAVSKKNEFCSIEEHH